MIFLKGKVNCVEAERYPLELLNVNRRTVNHGGLKVVGAIGLFHVNDYPAKPARSEISDADRIFPGDGVAPLHWIYRTLHRIGYHGYLSVELFRERYVSLINVIHPWLRRNCENNLKRRKNTD